MFLDVSKVFGLCLFHLSACLIEGILADCIEFGPDIIRKRKRNVLNVSGNSGTD